LAVELGHDLEKAQATKRRMELSWKKSKQQMRRFKRAASNVLTIGEKSDLKKYKVQHKADKKKHAELKVKMSGEISMAKRSEIEEIRKIKDTARAQVATETSREAVERKEMKGIEGPGEIHRKAKREVTAIKDEREQKIKMAKKQFKETKELIKAQELVE